MLVSSCPERDHLNDECHYCTANLVYRLCCRLVEEEKQTYASRTHQHSPDQRNQNKSDILTHKTRSVIRVLPNLLLSPQISNFHCLETLFCFGREASVQSITALTMISTSRVRTILRYNHPRNQCAASSHLILSLNSRPELLHQPQAVPERRLVHQHRQGQLHLHLPTRLHRQNLRDRDQRVRQQPLQERRQLQSE